MLCLHILSKLQFYNLKISVFKKIFFNCKCLPSIYNFIFKKCHQPPESSICIKLTFQPEIHKTGQNDYDDMASIMKTAESSCSKQVEASKDYETRGVECLNADLDNRIYHKMNLRVDN